MLSNDCLRIILSDNADTKLIMGQLNWYWYNMSRSYINSSLIEAIQASDHFSVIRHQTPNWWRIRLAAFYVFAGKSIVLQKQARKVGTALAILTGLAYSGKLSQIMEFPEADIMRNLYDILIFAMCGSQEHVCNYLIEQYPEPSNYERSISELLRVASGYWMNNVIDKLITIGEPDFPTCLCFASYSGNITAIKKIIPYTHIGDKLFYHMTRHGYMYITEFILPYIITPDNWYMCLLGAYRGGHVEIFMYLIDTLEYGFNKNTLYQLNNIHIDTLTPQLESLDDILKANLHPIPISAEGKAKIQAYIDSA